MSSNAEQRRSSARRVAICQSNYIPWKGYFDLIRSVDEFILFDTAQYTRNDWRNRNRIKTRSGAAWISIPVRNHLGQTVAEAEVNDPSWNKRHWKTLVQHYARARYFEMYRSLFEELYMSSEEKSLSRLNHRFLTAICQLLEIRTRFTWSSDYPEVDGRTE